MPCVRNVDAYYEDGVLFSNGTRYDIVVSTRQRFEERKEIPSVENEVVSKGVLIYGE